MGQIAACLTDLICLIEQRVAFGFTSPSKAADSASVKKRGSEKGKEKKTHTHTPQLLRHTYAHAQAHTLAFGRVYLLVLNILFIALTPGLFQVISHQTKTAGLENLSTVSVID